MKNIFKITILALILQVTFTGGSFCQSSLTFNNGQLLAITNDGPNPEIKLADKDNVLYTSGVYVKNMDASLNEKGKTLTNNDGDLMLKKKFVRQAITNGITNILVNTENGPIKKGDFLCISSTPGTATKATKTGFIVGVALEDATGNTLIKARVMMQYLQL
jgi:hypothetical protein